MGKKSRKPNKCNVPKHSTGETIIEQYTSDGPSEEELNCLQTSSFTLQTKLDLLTEFAINNQRSDFVHAFVPLDLSHADIDAYLDELTNGPEADGQWTNLIAEVAAIAAGRGVTKIEGDQITKAVFFFQHPLFPGCDREVSFTCTNGEWRAEG